MKKAIIRSSDNVVVNIIEFDPGSVWSPPPGHETIDVIANCRMGAVRAVDGTFAPMPPSPPPRVVDYEAFQDRFAAAELVAVTEFVDEITVVTGKPKRPALKQAVARIWARGTVDLLSARMGTFMDALVTGDAITAARKTEILTP